MLKATDFRGLYAIIPTPATPNAAAWDAVSTVDLRETVRLVEQLLADGIDGLIALGTTGECATLTAPEFEAFAETVLSTVAGRVPTIMGTTALGLHEVIRRTRFVQERGASGILLGLPMWQPCTIDMATRYYAAVSEAFRELALMVYANARAFRFNFSDPAFWQALLPVAPTVVAAKFSRAGALADLQKVTAGRVHFLPHDDAVYSFFKIAPESTTACWATSASMGPEPARALIDAILAGELDRAKSISDDIAWANEPTNVLTKNPDLFASYNIQMEKTRITSSGYCNAGPNRPPYDVFPDEYRAGAEECGTRWKTLRPKYARTVAAKS